MSLPFGPPYPVSPLIRGLRWAFLIAGIFYGQMKQKIYEAKEETWREEEAERKVIRDKHMAIMRARIAKEERETVKLLETGKLFEEDLEISEESFKRKKSEPSPYCEKCGCKICDCER